MDDHLHDLPFFLLAGILIRAVNMPELAKWLFSRQKKRGQVIQKINPAKD